MTNTIHTVIFGSGCFWCTEAVFKMVRGVTTVASGYAGGTVANPTYEEVSSGRTGHAEVVKIEYDSSVINFKSLLIVFFGSHDPTTLNRQGNDVGTQYRSIVFCENEDQIKEVKEFVESINTSSVEGASVVTEVRLIPHEGPGQFFKAETYHQNYYAENKSAPYCQVVINPKLEKVQKELAEFLK